MDFERIERRLKKINVTLANYKEEPEITKHERDLLLSYVVDLHTLISEGSYGDSKAVLDASAFVHIEKPTPQIATSIGIPVVMEHSVVSAPPAEVPATPIPTVQYESVQKPILEPVVAMVVEAPKVELPNPVFQAPAQEPMKAEEVEQVMTAGPLSAEMRSLFEEEKITDLSEKLSRSQVDDINKTMGINERIFTVTELFGGNNQLFSETIQRLNSFSKFEEAKHFLSTGIAKDMKWDSDDKWKKAYQFVRNVRRKYPL